ncbi:MAG: M20/M25/M40 family metallo-hydrolase [Acidobacteria bacterium]|nr:MAG: M20/M25/M40 family metallo-hydrolase [Acidobacteriota bacterium]
MDGTPILPAADERLGRRVLAWLERLVRIDSQSDETSSAIPSTPGQKELADVVAAALAAAGARVERDAHASVLASLPGRGPGAGAPPLAFSAHLDTSRGTRAVDRLHLLPGWRGEPIPYPANPSLVVDARNYPAARPFIGQDIVHGPGDAPFGLDDKLGLAEMLVLAELLAERPEIPRPPLLLIARADEEIGRMEAVVGLAEELARRGVRTGFTLDGIAPYEINVENFNASQATVFFPDAPLERPVPPGWRRVTLALGGVNTHGATAREEGYRAATRFAAEILARLERIGIVPARAVPAAFASDPSRDCDGVFELAAKDAPPVIEAIRAAAAEIVEPHAPRGARLACATAGPVERRPGRAAGDALRFVGRLLSSRPGFPIAAEESSGREGYSAPYRSMPVEGGQRVDVRLRDFDAGRLRERERHVEAVAREGGGPAPRVEIARQYVNMGPRLAERPELLDWPRRAAEAAGVAAEIRPIRGGTGVDPFLDRGTALANLGTGYFAPESEKEFTSLQAMAGHVRWLAALVQVAAAARPR